MTKTQLEDAPLYNICKDEIIKIIKDHKLTEKENEILIYAELYLLPYKIIMELKTIYSKYTEAIYINDNYIKIDKDKLSTISSAFVKVKVSATTTSINKDDNDIDIESPIEKFEDKDAINTLLDSLSPLSQKVLTLIINPPADFTDKHGCKPSKRNISKYLGLTIKQVKDVWAELRMSYINCIGHPYE